MGYLLIAVILILCVISKGFRYVTGAVAAFALIMLMTAPWNSTPKAEPVPTTSDCVYPQEDDVGKFIDAYMSCH